ncbi:MAG: putative signal transducing protein [Candidatus Aminicenantales bacterium]
MSEDDITLKEVHRVWGLSEAEIIKSFLESNGIDCLFQGRNVQTVYPITTDGMGEIRIMVKESDYEAAKALLEEKADEIPG